MNHGAIFFGIAFAAMLLLTIALYARLMTWLLTDNDNDNDKS